MQLTRYALLVAALTSTPALAQNELQQAADALCENVRSCAMASVRQEDMTPEMRAMMEPMLKDMCAKVRAGIADAPVDHALYKPAVACMQSMAALSCADFQDGDAVQTEECKSYQAKAEAAMGQ